MMTERQLNEAIDRYVTQEPPYYDGCCDNDEHELCEECGKCPICDGCSCSEMTEDKMFDVVTSYMKKKDAMEEAKNEDDDTLNP